jgi:hypothetical protein
VKHHALPEFWAHYRSLPEHIQKLADKNFQLLQSNSAHPSLKFKKAGVLWSVRVGIHYRALAKDRPDGAHWFWIGPHSEYDRFLS